MTTLFDAVNTTARTANGMATNFTSTNRCVDLFFLIGSSRGKDITPEFIGAFAENPEVAVRILQWARDARGGAGERDTFTKLLAVLVKQHQDVAERLVAKVPELGRWSDILVFMDTPLESLALEHITLALRNGDGLCAKWMPRPTGKNKLVANKIRKAMNLTPSAYRKLLVSLSNTVEQQMCAGQWSAIEFGKVPSLASARYQKAFGRNAETEYGEYISALEKGEAKINAGAVYPYDVLKSVEQGNAKVADQQWKALPDFLAGSTENILPVVDVSGSMGCIAGGSGTLSCMDVAVSLGLYLSERSQGAFKDQFITFSMAPQMLKLTGSLSQRNHQMRRAEWGMNTNLEAVFETVLNAATANSVPASEMPSQVIILSDMEFDSAMRAPGTGSSYGWGHRRPEANPPAMAMIEQMYTQAGYEVPKVVFWNLNARPGNVPVKADKSGAALVSGFSPSIMTSLLGGDDFTPEAIMLKTVMVERYDF